ncbi:MULTISPECIES: hypothetical protein [unclassified Arthrobacter]|uniref:hypothetical protein n=1 Tax=unclassified Arthrobacter TaxID=235627 RepID=UPI0011AFF41B|nr:MULTISPECIES: hypothetical protein [unclassified Arthrobacter]
MEKSRTQRRWRGVESLILAILLALIGAGAVAAGSHKTAAQATSAEQTTTSEYTTTAIGVRAS